MLFHNSSRQGSAHPQMAGLGHNPKEKICRMQSLIAEHLSQLNVESALFVAELLYAECMQLEGSSQERAGSYYLYSLCLFMDGDFNSAMHVSNERKHDNVGCAYIFTRCCMRLRKKYSEALDCLLSLQSYWDDIEPLFGYPKKATLCMLTGKLFKLLDHESKSGTFLRLSLDENPYLWESLKDLCSLRNKLALTVFKQSQPKTTADNKMKQKPQTPFKAPSRNKQGLSNSQTNSLLSASNVGGTISPHFFKKSRASAIGGYNNGVSATGAVDINNKLNPSLNNNSNTHTFGIGSNNQKATNTNITPPSKLSGTDSNRLLRSPTERKPKLVNSSDLYLDEMFSNFVTIEFCKCKYDSFKAIRTMKNNIPPHISSNMPWCLSILGKLHFELVNYEMSKSHFEKLRTIQPTRFQDMDIYSTVLWHLQDKNSLSYLCAELMSLDKYNSVAWCSLGNLHSLNKDHDEAINAFGKSIQLDPYFAYAYTLQGHEYSNNDAFDNAKSCFRKALAIDRTHYNALYGLGMCCVKLGKFENALLYFEKARALNPVNVILNCCCGVALERLQQTEKALYFYELANELQPNSSLALFKKSQLLLNMGQYSSALQNFEKLETLTPDEAHVHFLLGHLYQIVGKKQDAMNQYTIAMNLDPKGSQLIKEAMEKCHEQG